jgi:RIO kinase 2
MGRLDVTLLRYLDRHQFRFLTAVEMGMKNHELVPLALVVAIGQLKGTVALSRSLSKDGLVCYETSRKKNYDGVRLTNKGYDYLALKVGEEFK